MKVSTSLLLATSAFLTHARAVNERSFEGGVLEARVTAAWTKGGCYSSAGSLQNGGTNIYQSQGACSTTAGSNNNVIAMSNGDECYYGTSLPPSSDKVDDSKCSMSCVGFPSDNCGAKGFYRVYTTGNVASGGSSNSDSDSDSSSASPSPSPSSDPDSSSPTQAPATTVQPSLSVITASGQQTTIFLSQQPEPTVAAATVSVSATSSPTDQASGGGTSKGAIAAGVVVGVVGAAAVAGAIFFWLRSRKHREEAAELQRQNSIAGLRSEKPPSTYSMPDSRLEPAYMRRISDGSIADNQDYSRRILKVTNPDDR